MFAVPSRISLMLGPSLLDHAVPTPTGSKFRLILGRRAWVGVYGWHLVKQCLVVLAVPGLVELELLIELFLLDVGQIRMCAVKSGLPSLSTMARSGGFCVRYGRAFPKEICFMLFID